MKIEKIDKKEALSLYLPEVIRTIWAMNSGDFIKIENYTKKTPMPQYLQIYVNNGVLEKSSYSTRKINKETYLIYKK